MTTATLTPDTAIPGLEKLREELAQIEEDVVTGYTLADAMREGSTVSRQRRNGWIEADGRACALGAAYIAARARSI